MKVRRTQSSDRSDDCSCARRDVQQSSRDHRAMNQVDDVAVLVGRLRNGSFTRKTATALSEVAPAALKSIVQIGAFAFYNEDLAAHAPQNWRAFRARVKAADALLFAAPDYNRSVPAVQKNALDVGSRPYGQSSWRGKPGAIVSVSAAALGAFAANHHVRQCMVFLNVPVMPQPEVYIGGAAELFNAEGALTRDSTPEYFTNSCWPSPPAAPATASMLSGSA